MSSDIDVTFVVLSYRQEQVVEQAIAAAFAQDFDGRMEILLTDDASPDGTYEVMERMAADYTGPHTVRLNRNPENIGAIAHVNRVFELARGALIIINAGDDVSLPARSAMLHARFVETEPRPLMIHSPLKIIRMDGTPTGEVLDVHARIAGMGPHTAAISTMGCYGASCAWNREMFDIYGPMTETGAYGDLVSTYRAKLPGRLAHVDTPLVLYRQGGVSDLARMTPEQRIDYKKRRQAIQIAVLRQRLADTRRAAPNRRRLIGRLKSHLSLLTQPPTLPPEEGPPPTGSATGAPTLE